MRRRQPVEDPAAPPLWLRRFRLDEWLDVIPPEPEWYREREAAAKPGDRYSWRVFAARIAYMRARRAWVKAQSGT